MRFRLHLLFVFYTFYSFSAHSQTMGNRVIGMNVNQAQNGSYDSAIYYAQNACVKVVNMLVTWNTIETSPHIYNASLFTIADNYYPAKGLELSVNLAPINTNVLCVPADLQSISFADTEMIHRYERVVDTMFSAMPNVSLYCLNIGNESDIYFNGDSVATYQYKVFYDSVRNYIKKTHPALRIGTTLTWAGLTGVNSHQQHKLNSNSDIISVTYYGINNNYTVKAPSQVPNDFASLVTQYPDSSQPICLQECGYPTSDTCLSNDSLQNVFMYYVFQAWGYYKSNISFVSFLNETDWSTAYVDTLANYYNYHNPVWMEYLRTLGLRTYPGNGTSKPAYNMLVYQAALRNACGVSGIETLNESGQNFNIYPNPAIDHIYIATTSEMPARIELFNTLGQALLINNTGNRGGVELTGIPPGFYIIQALNKEGTVIGRQKLIVQ